MKKKELKARIKELESDNQTLNQDIMVLIFKPKSPQSLVIKMAYQMREQIERMCWDVDEPEPCNIQIKEEKEPFDYESDFNRHHCLHESYVSDAWEFLNHNKSSLTTEQYNQIVQLTKMYARSELKECYISEKRGKSHVGIELGSCKTGVTIMFNMKF
jgi:hypothetical protein